MISTLVTEDNIENNWWPLEKILYIHHLLRFWKDPHKTKTLIDLRSEVNTMTPAYTPKLGLKIRKTDIVAQKIDDSIIDTFRMVLANF